MLKWSESELIEVRKRLEPRTVRLGSNGSKRGAGRATDALRKPGKASRGALPTISEHQIQVSVIDWWNLWAAMRGIDPRLLFAVPNAGAGAQRGQAGKMKAEGVRAGVPDLCLALPSPVFHGAFFELKSKTGKVRPEQRGYHNLLRRMDYNVVTCFGVDETIRAIMVYCELALSTPK